MTNERLEEIERWNNDYAKIEWLTECIATIRKLQKPLAELLGPTIELLEWLELTLRNQHYVVVPKKLDGELKRLRALCASKGTHE